MMTKATFQDSTADRQALVYWRGKRGWAVECQQWSRHHKDHVTADTLTVSSQAKALRVARDWTRESWDDKRSGPR